MDFSIVLVSRERPNLLDNLLNSIERTTTLSYEILVGCDDDDQLTRNSVQAYLYKHKNVKFFFKPRRDNLHKYLNELAEMTTGDYIFGLNDDCEILNKDWDKKTREALDKVGPCCYGVTKDNSIDRVSDDYAAFPIVSRKAYEVLGFFMEEGFGNHGADVILHRIYSGAGISYKVPVEIRHIFHESTPMLQARLSDKTAFEMINRTFTDPNFLKNLYTYDVRKYIERLKEYNDKTSNNYKI